MKKIILRALTLTCVLTLASVLYLRAQFYTEFERPLQLAKQAKTELAMKMELRSAIYFLDSNDIKSPGVRKQLAHCYRTGKMQKVNYPILLFLAPRDTSWALLIVVSVIIISLQHKL